MSVRYRLAPQPEFRIQVPPQHQPGDKVRFTREDGVQVSVPVPDGLTPGENFEVTAPALMVRVPQGASPGSKLVFQNQGWVATKDKHWIRTIVPAGITPGRYFAARLPAPSMMHRSQES